MNDGVSLLTVKEVAELLRISLAGTYELIQSGSLLSYRIGQHRGAIRMSRIDVGKYLEGRRRGATVPLPTKCRTARLRHLRIPG